MTYKVPLVSLEHQYLLIFQLDYMKSTVLPMYHLLLPENKRNYLWLIIAENRILAKYNSENACSGAENYSAISILINNAGCLKQTKVTSKSCLWA